MKTLAELSRDIKIPYWRIKHAHVAGKIPEPEKVGGIRVYDKKMIAKVTAYFLGKE